MKSLSLSLILRAASLWALFPQSLATSNNNGVLVELRIRKPTTNAPASVQDAAILMDGGLSPFLFERAENTTVSQIEDLVREYSHIQKRQNKEKKECQLKQEKCEDDSQAKNPKTGKCEKCPDGKKANAAGDGCEKPKSDDKDKDGKCPAGQSMSTETRNQPSKCAPDNEPDKKCKAKDTFAFKKVGGDGKMVTTCRSTPEKEKDKKEKVWKAQESLSKSARGKERDDHDKERRIRARRGACLALGAVTWIPSGDITALTDEMISGLQEPETNSPLPDKDLEDHMIEIKEKHGGVALAGEVATEDAGLGSVFKAVFNLFKKLFGKGKGGGAAKAATTFKVAAPSKSGGRQFNDLRDPKNPQKMMKASEKAVNAAKNSQSVQKILKSQEWLDCVAMGAVAAAGAASKRDVKEFNHEFSADDGKKFEVHINFDAQKEDAHPSPNPKLGVLVVGDVAMDSQSPKLRMATYPDSYKREDRIPYEQCHSLAGTDVNNALVRVQNWGGCCAYYDGEHCDGKARFTLYDWSMDELKGGDAKSVSSFWCTHDPNCHGAPGDSETHRKSCDKAVGEEEIKDCYGEHDIM